VRMRVPFLTAGFAGLMALSVLALPAAATEDGPRGSAFAVSLDATLVNTLTATIAPQPKATYPSGDKKSVVKVDLNEQLAKVRALNASSKFEDGKLKSVGSVADVKALRDLIKATLIEAECTLTDKGLKGSSKLVDVTVGGIQVKADGQGELSLLDGSVTVKVNEQIRKGDALTVNALHITIGKNLKDLARADLILGSATCAGELPKGTPPTTIPTTSGGNQPGDPGAPGDSDGSGDNLANTGVSNVSLLLGIGGALLAAGVGVLVWLRRRPGSAKN
jgi:LPXTG-motif cell wall-anchored protein